MEGYHKSVLLKEVLDALILARQPRKRERCGQARFRQDGLVSAGKPARLASESVAGRDDWYLDCTLGDGGHAIEILKLGGKVLGLDVDPEALERARQRFERAGYSKYQLIQGNFRDIKNLLSEPVSTAKRGEQTDTDRLKIAGVIFDLGVSSLQLENPGRGFSFSKMGPLDMRMDPSLNIKALDFVNNLSGKELYEIFRDLGEEKYSKRLADALVFARKIKPITTTKQLTDVVFKAVGGGGRIHPATRVFQALRIVVNNELDALKEGLDQVKDLIRTGGCVLVISFHSLEDRIVKNTFKDWQIAGIGKVLTKKPVIPSSEEIEENPRSRSAKMRVFKKI